MKVYMPPNSGLQSDAPRTALRLKPGVGRLDSTSLVGSAPIVASYGLFNTFASEMTMTTNLEVLEAEALKLAPSDRSHLLERLIASLDSDPEVEEAWEHEADRREALLESGSVAEVSGPEAMSRLRSRLAR